MYNCHRCKKSCKSKGGLTRHMQSCMKNLKSYRKQHKIPTKTTKKTTTTNSSNISKKKPPNYLQTHQSSIIHEIINEK